MDLRDASLRSDLQRRSSQRVRDRTTPRNVDDDAAILAGYAEGVKKPRPIVLDRDWAWLREQVVVSDKQRAKFWSKIEEAKRTPAPATYRKALAEAMPQPRLDMWTACRSAGTGSLGRPRWIGVADWQGAPTLIYGA